MNSPKTFVVQQLLSGLKFILPLLAWLFVVRDFVFGQIPVNMDTNTIYSVTKFYFNNVINGVVPLWDPFVLLGTPFYAITICNLFNPVTQLVPVLKVLGVNYYDAFMTYIVVYYFLGAMGFYCLARTLFSDRQAAYIGYLLFLFSGIGASLFNQFTIVELCVPAVWFFLFWVRFCRNFRASDFLGLSYSAMIIVISYLPFYFATLFIFFLLLTAGLFHKELLPVVKGMGSFVRRHVILVVLCSVGVLMACAPLLVYKSIDASKDVVSPGRHCTYTDAVGCYERTINEEGGMSYKETSQSGGLAERVDPRGLFTHLDKVSYGADQFFFIPLVALLLILLTMFVPFDRVSVLIIGIGSVLTAVALADATPWYKLLYDHIFFFKYFRNLFFFEAYIIPIIILFVVGQLKRLTDANLASFSNKKAMTFLTVIVHAAAVIFLIRQDSILVTAYVTIAASLVLFLAFSIGALRKENRIFWGGLAFVVLVQPFEVYHHYGVNAREFQCELPKAHVRPQFSWTRPTEEVKSECKIFKFVHYETFYDSMAMKDGRGVIDFPASVTRGAFLLSQWIDKNILANFTRHKFYLFDQVRDFNEDPLAIRSLGEVLSSQKNVAYVPTPHSGVQATFSQLDWGAVRPEALGGPTENFKVLEFDVNRLKLIVNLTAKKFLVYTDSWTQHWHVTVNGREEKLLRSDGAFKGVWLPAGNNVVEFRYRPPGGGYVYILVTMVLIFFFGALVWSFYKEDNWPWMWEKT